MVSKFRQFSLAILSVLNRLTISRALVLVGVAMMSALTAIIALGLYTFKEVRIGGANFARINATKDLVADILPPPAYVIEAYLEARMAIAEPSGLAARVKRLEALRQSYEQRHEHWLQSTLVPEDLKRKLVVHSHAHVSEFWAEIQLSLLPLLTAQAAGESQIQNRPTAAAPSPAATDVPAKSKGIPRKAPALAKSAPPAEPPRTDYAPSIRRSLERLSGHYNAHRAIIENVAEQADRHADDVAAAVAKQGASLERWVGATLATLVGVVLLGMVLLRQNVVRPVLRTAAYLEHLRQGSYSTAAPFATRRDEIGTMAKAIDSLRLDAIERQRLEAEAADARRVRDRERAAEALRISSANEHINGLNQELQKTIKDLERAQEDNARKAKLAHLGQLTATVAHEIRNPLGAVKTSAHVIARKVKDKNLGVEPALQRINNGIQRCDTIITELLDFTRVKALSVNEECLDTWIATVVAEETKHLGSQVAFDLRAEVGDEFWAFDTSRMRRVVINLLSNAAEAMIGKPGSPLEKPTADPRIVVTTRRIGETLELIVADNGPGIAPEDLQRIRDPLFTTKSFGIGLGLSAIENILEQHGGGLRIVSAPGEGAVMTAWFPAVRIAVPRSEEQPAVA